MTSGDGAQTAHPLCRWSVRTLLAGVTLLGLGTMLVILGVRAPGLLLPGVGVLDAALLLLAAGLVLFALVPDA